ncbi:MAG: tyrosine--tRNA ligase, partial [Acidimicrobiaceae bacterium]|nr:tyrosine--tRNA ligase [Acidimicrobiaceae bacterium]
MSVVSELKERGLIYQYSADALLERLNNQRIVCYIGFDPSAESLHLGNLLQIIMLRRLQMAGHRPILLAGGGTGMIGDPSGKSDERQLL